MYQRKKENRLRSTLLRILVLCLPLALVLAMVTQTASAKTYVITDGNRVFTYTTSETNPEEILDEAGQTGIMIGCDCTVPHDIDDNRLEWVRQACVKYAEKNK